jgi:hypothetical protein
MRRLRTRSVGTKLTEDEYALVTAACPEPNLSDWIRRALLAAVRTQPTERVIVAELLALRAIVLALHFSIVSGERLTAERLHTLIDRADGDKLFKAEERLAGCEPRRR